MKKWDVYVYGDVNIDEIIKEAREEEQHSLPWGLVSLVLRLHLREVWVMIYTETISKILLINTM